MQQQLTASIQDNFAKQAKPYGFFEKVKVVSAGEGGSPETAISLKDDLPLGITTNAYDLFYYPDTPEHKAYVQRLKTYTKQEYPPSWAITGYIAMQFLVEGIKKANSTDTNAVIKALEGLTMDHPHRQTDHAGQGSPGHPGSGLGNDGQSSGISLSHPAPGGVHPRR